MAVVARCRSCGEAIWWLLQDGNPQARPAPIEVRETENGNIVAYPERGAYTIVKPGDGDRVNHFVNCPERKRWSDR